MAVKKFLTDIDFSQNQSISRVIENRTTPPATPVEGQEYYDIVTNQAYFFDGTGWVQYGGVGTVTSVGLTMPPAFLVANSPITTAGDINVTANGVASQYIRGDGQLATLPTSTGGGGSVTYYLNGSINQGTFGGNTYYQMSRNAIIGAGTDFNINADGFIARFITDANDPNLLEIPVGAWNLAFFFSASSGGGNPRFYTNIYKTDGTTFTLLGTNSATPEGITGGTAIDQYYFSVAIPTNSLLPTDRIAIDIYVVHSGRIITLHTEDSHLCEVITTLSTGITALNGLTDQTQYLAVGTSGTDFGISSIADTHTFNLPIASALNTGKLSDTDWTNFNNKADDNIYTADGTLTGIRTLNQLLFGLRFLGTGGTTRIDQNNGAGVSASIIETLSSIGLQVISGVNSGAIEITKDQIEQIVTGTTSTSQYTQTDLQFLNFVTGALGNTNYIQTETSLDISVENGITGFISNIQQVFNAIKLVLSDAGSIEIASLKVLPTGVQINGDYLLPFADGLAGQVMTTDGAGNVTFQTPSSGTNIYNADGTLTANRTVNFDTRQLVFTGTQGGTVIKLDLKATTGSGNRYANISATSGTAINQLFVSSGSVGLQAVASAISNAVTVDTTAIILNYDDGVNTFSIIIDNFGVQVNNAYTLPPFDGTANQVLTTNGAGVLSFTTLPTANNIYNADGTLTGTRVLDANLNDLSLENLNVYTVKVTPTGGTQAYVINVNTASMSGSIGTRIFKVVDTNAGLERFGILRNGNIRFNNAYTFPLFDGSAGQVLATDGVGVLSFADVTALPSFIPFISETEIRRGCIALNNSTTQGTYGAYTPALTGSAVALLMGTGTITKLPKLRILTTTGSTNSTVGIIFGSQSLIQSLQQGFRFVGSYIFNDVSAGGTEWFVPNARQFIGLTGTSTLIAISSVVTVQSLTNIIGMGSDVGDTNLQIFHNDASGVATKIDLGASFPANKTGAVANGIGYQLELYAPLGATTVNYRVTRLTDGTQVTGTISTDLPASITLLCPQVCRTSGSTSQNVSIDFIQLTAYTLN